MYTYPKMNYKGDLTKGKHKWIEIYKGRWLLTQGCKKFRRGPWNQALQL
jgi:hypothetical protein